MSRFVLSGELRAENPEMLRQVHKAVLKAAKEVPNVGLLDVDFGKFDLAVVVKLQVEAESWALASRAGVDLIRQAVADAGFEYTDDADNDAVPPQTVERQTTSLAMA